MWRRLVFLRQFKLRLIHLVRLRSDPDAIARGMALGLFVGFTPIFGLHLPLALLLAFLLRQNKIAALVGVWVTNPLTAPLIYGLEYQIGRMLLGQPPLTTIPRISELSWSMVLQLGTPLLLGSLVLGFPMAMIGYALTVRFVPCLKLWKIPRWPRPKRKSRPPEKP